ncbi:MAG TPA: hypothetical protein VEJ67_08290 [Candidatus Cybelea sp.]|nr:hypothetical protein [Candidatus Cybelea sp.]
MRGSGLLALVAVTALAGASFAQQKTDYTGTWKLNVDKSDFGPVPGPSSETQVIEQSGETVKVNVRAETEQGKTEFLMTLVTDGKQVSVPADDPLAHPAPEATLEAMAASWDGNVLVVNEKLTYGGDPVSGVARYTLSPDGKVLTIHSDYTSQMGDASRTFVFDKVVSSAEPDRATPTSSTASAPEARSKQSADSASGSEASSSRPNLSGIWVLDSSKSDFGPMPPPESRTDTIEDEEPSFKLTVKEIGGPMGDVNFTMSAVTDGKTVSNWKIFGSDAKSTAHWDGQTLVVQTDTSMQDQPVKLVSKYTLAPDGTLSVDGHFSSAMGEGATKLVFTKK